MLKNWYNLSEQLKDLRNKEMELRKELFAYYFPKPKLGINRIEIGGGYDLESTYKLDYKMDYDQFCDLCKLEGSPMAFEEVVDYEPEFRLTRFKALPPEGQEFVMQALTVKPAAPSLSIVQKKVKK